MRRLCFFTGSRADYGLLLPVMRRVATHPQLELQIVATAMHLSTEFGLTYQAIEDDGFRIDATVEMLLASDTPVGVAKSLGLGTIGCGEALERLAPDIVVLLGDRFEALAAAQAATLTRLPIAHIHGGETTEGAIDEAFRHAITKMSHLHFVAAEPFRRRVIRLGEHPDRVFTVGAPGLDNIRSLPLLDREDVERRLAIELKHPLILATYHPATLEAASLSALDDLLATLDRFDGATVVFTKSNADPAGRRVGSLVDAYSAERPNVHAFTSLGQLLYLSLMQLADVVVGNSSSGIIEAPALATPSVNIGSRQRGRLRAGSVIDVDPPSVEGIEEAIRRALSSEFRDEIAGVHSPYGDGAAAPRIVEILAEVPLEGIVQKSFYDGAVDGV